MQLESAVTNNGRSPVRVELPKALLLLLVIGLGMILLAWSDRQAFASWSALRFLAGVALFIYLPGAIVLRLFGWGLSSERSLSLALCAGIPFGLGLYWLLAPALPRFGYLALSILALVVVVWRRRELLRSSLPRAGSWTLVGALAICGLTIWSLSQTAYRGGRRTGDGGLSYLHAQVYRDTKVGGSDALFHAAVTGALARSPSGEPNPFVSGEPLAYHYGMDLLAAMFTRELGIHPLDLAARLFPTFFLLLLCALVYGTSRALGLGAGMSLLATLLLFGADFSILLYLFPIHPEWPLKYWLAIFTSYPATSFFWVNPHLPALVVFTGGALALATTAESAKGRLLASILLGATALFKVYLAFHVGLALVAAAAWCFLRTRDRVLVAVTVVAGLVMLGVALGHGFYGGSQVEMRFEFLPLALRSFRAAGLKPLADALQAARWQPGPSTLVPALGALFFYIVMVLGVRAAAIPRGLSWIRDPRPDRARVFLAFFFLLGLIPPLFWVVAASGLNSTYFFFNQSLFVGGIVLADTIGAVPRLRWRALAGAAVLVLALTPTLRDIAFWGNLPDARWPATELEAALYLRSASQAEEVVLHPVFPDTPSPASHIGGLPTVLTYWQGYPYSFASVAEVEQRLRDVNDFFRTRDPLVARGILERYGVTWVYSLKDQRPILFSPEGLLNKAYENEAVVLYRAH